MDKLESKLANDITQSEIQDRIKTMKSKIEKKNEGLNTLKKENEQRCHLKMILINQIENVNSNKQKFDQKVSNIHSEKNFLENSIKQTNESLKTNKQKLSEYKNENEKSKLVEKYEKQKLSKTLDELNRNKWELTQKSKVLVEKRKYREELESLIKKKAQKIEELNLSLKNHQTVERILSAQKVHVLAEQSKLSKIELDEEIKESKLCCKINQSHIIRT